MIKNIFFDFDGVILESLQVKGQAFHDLYLPYGKEVAEKVIKHHLENGGISRYEKFKIYHKEFLGKDINEDQVNELAQQFSNIVVKRVIASNKVTGVKTFLENNKDRKFWIISATPDKELVYIVKSIGFDSFFVGIYGSSKRKSAWVNGIIEEESLSRDESIFIGDTNSDYTAAKESDIGFVLRETGIAHKGLEDFKGAKISDFTTFESVLGDL